MPTKLAVALLMPMLLAFTLGGLRIADRTEEAENFETLDQYVALRGKTSLAIDQLQRERAEAAVFLQHRRAGEESRLRAAVVATDAALAELSSSARRPTVLSGAPSAVLDQAQRNLAELGPLRQRITKADMEPAAAIGRYTGLIEALIAFGVSLDRQLTAPPLAGMAPGLSALTSAREQVALQYAVIAVAIARGEMLPSDADTVRTSDARFTSALDQLRVGLTVDQQARYADFVADPVNNERLRLKQAALSRVGAPGQLGLSANDWEEAYQSVAARMRASEEKLRGEIRASGAAQAAAAHRWAIIDSVLLGLVMLGGLIAAYLVGKSLLKPLRLLRRTALDVAERRLPKAVRSARAGDMEAVDVAPIAITSGAEIGKLAQAFDLLHRRAVTLVAEQAALRANASGIFVHLARRDRALVERQQRLIEQLERTEPDAGRLAQLFQLDQVAAQIRRHSTNMLVLAEEEPGKRGGARVALVDVLHAAVAEIEQYQRVVIQPPPLVDLQGGPASDLVHLMTELLENATNFSEPDTQVVVSSGRGQDGSLVVRVIDQGVGMPGDELIVANNRLAEAGPLTSATFRQAGLLVVGRLAARHDIEVQLTHTNPARAASGGGGVTAVVTVPSALVISSGGRDTTGVDAQGVTGSGAHAAVESAAPALVASGAHAAASGAHAAVAPPERAEVISGHVKNSGGGRHAQATPASQPAVSAVERKSGDLAGSRPAREAELTLGTGEREAELALGSETHRAHGEHKESRDDDSPIFEEMASVWFRENWQIDTGSSEQGESTEPAVSASGRHAERGDRERRP